MPPSVTPSATDLVGFDDLAALTRAIVADPRWRWGGVRIRRDPNPARYGSAAGHVVAYADQAPAVVVVHELAHIAARDASHGPRWRARFAEIVGWVTNTDT